MKKTELEDSLIKDVQSRRIAIQEALFNWGAQHYRSFPWRKERTPYSVLISEVLLKRTTASATTHVYEEFMALYPNIQTLSKADKKELESLLSRIGYHKRRAEILLEIANHITTKYGGQIPKSRDELLEIPHVGNYTANAVLSFGYGIPAAIVDSNVERIIRRVFLKHFKGKSSKLVQKIADELSPGENNQLYNYTLLDLGAAVCRYGIPRCKVCPINSLCDYYLSGSPFSEKNRS
jgi:A/G-specific adenine glycosylase